VKTSQRSQAQVKIRSTNDLKTFNEFNKNSTLTNTPSCCNGQRYSLVLSQFIITDHKGAGATDDEQSYTVLGPLPCTLAETASLLRSLSLYLKSWEREGQ